MTTRNMLNRRDFARVSLAALVAGCAAPGGGSGGETTAPGDTRDIVLHGGPIYTGVQRTPTVEAIRIRAGRIVVAGSLADARAESGARMIDLDGAAAFPGFKDSHVHLGGVGLAAMTLDLVGTPSIAAMLQSLRTYARAHPEGPIVGRGWIETHWPEARFPTRADVDAVVRDRPVYLERIDGHAAVVNSAALALAGIDGNTADPAGGRIERDASGAATGMLIDNATGLVERRLPPPTPEMRRTALERAGALYASRGWTGAANMSTSAEEARIFAELAAAGRLPLHVDIYLTPEDSSSVFERGPYADPTGLVNVRGVKLYMDGALGSRGAALLAPYSDAPGNGLIVTDLDVMRQFYTHARERNVQVATHAIGDRGNRAVLDGYERAFTDNPSRLLAARWRVEHAQVLSPQDLPRFSALGVIASMQPSHAISDLYFAPSRLGPNRLSGAYAWRSLVQSGAVVCAGTDAPVEKGDPLIEFYAASYRHALDGFAGPDWHLEETVPRDRALQMLTIAGAYATFQEDERGTLTVGKRADVSAFSVDLMQADYAQIPTAHAALTIADGKVTHSAL